MKYKLFALLAILTLVLSACGRGNVATATSAPAATQAPIATQPPAVSTEAAATEAPAVSAGGGGTVVLVIPEEPAGLNRFVADEAIVYQVSDATVIGLTTPNEKGEYEPRLAADLPTISDDHKTVTWKLRDG